MEKKSELPDESWPEEKILELLRQNISGPSTSQEVRLICLDELRKRKNIKRVEEVVEILLEIARVHGRSTPESSMIVGLVSRLANLDERAFNKLLNAMTNIQDNLLYCFARIVRNLEDDKKKDCTLRLLFFLMKYGSFTNITDEMYQTLIGVDNEEIKKDILKETLPYLRDPDPYKVVYAVRITSGLASEFITDLEVVVQRVLNSWYDGYKEEILKNICELFGKIKDEKSIPYLLQILRLDFNKEVVSKTLASVIDAHPQAIDKIWEFLREEREHYLPILMVLEKMETSIDVERLFSVLDINLKERLLHFSLPIQTLKNITIKSGKQAKQLLLKMIMDENQDKYTFALDCLEEIGVSIEEYSRVFEKSPITQVYEFFYGKKEEMLLENLWKEQDKLGEPVKHAQTKRFDHFIQNLFAALGFVTLYVDSSGREGVDVVAFSPNQPYILVIGCTTGIMPDDLKKLNVSLTEMKDTLKELFQKYRILPMVITSKRVDVSSTDSEYAAKHNIAILTHDEATNLLKMLKTNRKSDEIIKHVKQSIPGEVVRL